MAAAGTATNSNPTMGIGDVGGAFHPAESASSHVAGSAPRGMRSRQSRSRAAPSARSDTHPPIDGASTHIA